MDDTTRSRARAPRHLRHPNLQPPWAAPVHRARSPGATDTSRYRSLWAPGGGLHSPNLRNRQTSPRAPRAHPGALPAAMAVQAVSANGSQPHNSAWACGRASPTAHPAPRPASRAPPPAPRAGTGCSLGPALSSFPGLGSGPSRSCHSAATRFALWSSLAKVACVFTTRFILVPPALFSLERDGGAPAAGGIGLSVPESCAPLGGR